MTGLILTTIPHQVMLIKAWIQVVTAAILIFKELLIQLIIKIAEPSHVLLKPEGVVATLHSLHILLISQLTIRAKK
jgi:hypothetical protein